MRILLMALTEGPADVAPEIAMVLLTIVDRPRTRVFLDGGVDLEVFHVFFGCSYYLLPHSYFVTSDGIGCLYRCVRQRLRERGPHARFQQGYYYHAAQLER